MLAIDLKLIRDVLHAALQEDIGTGDITSCATIPESASATARYTTKQPLAVSGVPVIAELIRMVDSKLKFKAQFADGDYVILHVHAVREPGTLGRAIVDIFRLENGKIVEHWDVAQDIPEKMPHNNGMF